MGNIYREKGYEDRNEYLLSLAEEYEMDLGTVRTIADLLGPSEDFDGLLSDLEDYAMMFGGEE